MSSEGPGGRDRESSGLDLANEEIDIFKLAPEKALKLMSASLDAIVQLTGDVPPTPPPSEPSTPNMRSIQAERETVRSHVAARGLHSELEALSIKDTALGSPPDPGAGSGSFPPLDHRIPEANVQHRAIIRKFYSKRPPPISIEDYLLRMHQFCPMSTGVYLATSLYLHRLAVFERVLSLTPRNVHRLLLGALRIAMKALEDLSYPHSRFSKAGGVTAAELSRLEISFCFVTNFDLRVDAQALTRHAASLKALDVFD